MPSYRKGEGQQWTGLKNRAVEQRIQEFDADRKLSPAQSLDRDIASGKQGAKDVVNLKMTVGEMESRAESLKGPVSGSEMAKLKARNSQKRIDNDKDKKRR